MLGRRSVVGIALAAVIAGAAVATLVTFGVMRFRRSEPPIESMREPTSTAARLAAGDVAVVGIGANAYTVYDASERNPSVRE